MIATINIIGIILQMPGRASINVVDKKKTTEGTFELGFDR